MDYALDPSNTIFMAGHRGMVGSALLRCLKKNGFKKIVTRTSTELDLTCQAAVEAFFSQHKIDVVMLAAAKVGGILANKTYPADFIYINLMIQNNVIHSAWKHNVKNLLFLGSSCIYPRLAKQPLKEEYLLTSSLEPTNAPYAIAKIAGIKMCEAYNRQYGTVYRAVMPTNLYGPGDNYHLEKSHVIPAMIRKYHLAKMAKSGNVDAIVKDEERYGPITGETAEAVGYLGPENGLDMKKARDARVVLWGTGKARREFLHVDDMAGASLFFMNQPASCFTDSGNLPFYNVGTGKDITIAEAAEIVAQTVGFDGNTVFNSSKPDGTPRKLLDITRTLKLGWQASIGLREGIRATYQDYQRK